MDLRENFTTDVTVEKEELIQFWQSIVSRSVSRNFLKDSSILRDMTFFYNFGSYLRKN